jgi:hypothetical protein
MSHGELDAIGEELREACKKDGISNFSIERAYQIGEGLRGARAGKLASIAPAEAAKGEPFDLLLLFDVIAATASLEAASVGAAIGGTPVSSDVIDLWIQATAARALWFERFVQWPNENSAKKLEHLRDTARKLGAESIARGLVEGVQPFKFTEFVGRLSNV